MAVAYRSSSGAGGSGLITSINVSIPPGTLNGDLLVAVLVNDYQASGSPTHFTPNAPAGWTATQGGFNHIVNAGGIDTMVTMFQKTATGTEPSSYNFSITDGIGSAGNMCVGVAAFSGAQSTARSNAFTTRIIGSSLASGALTGTQSTDMVILVGGVQNFNGSSSGTVTGGPITSGWTSAAGAKAQASASAHAGCATAISYQIAGTTGTFDCSGGGGNNTYNMCVISASFPASTTVLVPDTDTGTGVDFAVGHGLGDEQGTATDSASVVAVIPGADTASAADAGISLVPIPATDAGSAADTAVVHASVPGADAAVGAEQFTVLNTGTGGILAFGADASYPTAENAHTALGGSYGDTGAALDTAVIAIQGPIPSGYQRVIRIQKEVTSVTGT